MSSKFTITIGSKIHKVGHMRDAELTAFCRKTKMKHACTTKKGNLLGFTTDADFLAWAARNKLKERTKTLMKKVSDASKRAKALTPGEEDSLERFQKRKMNFHTWNIRNTLKELKIQPGEINKLPRLTKDIDEIRGPVISTVFVYNYSRYRGSWRYLWPGAHPRLSSYGFNDKINSVWVYHETLLLCQHSYWRGAWFWYYWPTPYLGWFKNRASSAYIWV